MIISNNLKINKSKNQNNKKLLPKKNKKNTNKKLNKDVKIKIIIIEIIKRTENTIGNNINKHITTIGKTNILITSEKTFNKEDIIKNKQAQVVAKISILCDKSE